jgi:pimeloyl-ACP methyl ester carboxylesterase
MSVDLIGPEPKIAVKRAGEGPLLLLFHGIGGSKENWNSQLDVFSTGFKAGAWDARGYGDSQDYPGPCDFDDFARDVLKVVDFYGRRKAHLMGLSMGGRIAQRFYFMFPERVASLTLCDTQMTFQQRSDADREAFLAARQAPLLAGKTPRDIAPAVVKSLVGPNATAEAIQICIDSMNKLRTDLPEDAGRDSPSADCWRARGYQSADAHHRRRVRPVDTASDQCRDGRTHQGIDADRDSGCRAPQQHGGAGRLQRCCEGFPGDSQASGRWLDSRPLSETYELFRELSRRIRELFVEAHES